LRTEKLGYSVVILLAVSSVLSIIIYAAPVSATSATAPTSPATVVQGDVFLLRGSITFDKPDQGYWIYGPVYWYSYGQENENFVLENTPSVYWTSGGTGVGNPVENISINDYAIPDGWQVDIGDDGNGLAANGTFNIDIYLRAASGDGTLHAAGDENIYFALDQITMFEPALVAVPAGPIDVNVTGVSRGVTISITPGSQSGWTGDNLVYNVNVKNTGDLLENFALTVSDNASWSPTLDNNLFENIAPGDNRQTTLRVTVAGSPGNTDNLQVTAKSMDNTVENSATCQAHHALAGVNVTIVPTSENVPAGGPYDYAVTVTNNGDKPDTFNLSAIDNIIPSWNPSLDDIVTTLLNVGASFPTTLHVTMPDNVLPDNEDTITVTATSQGDNTVENSATCTLKRIIARGVQVEIVPSPNSAGPGENAVFTVTVKNTGGLVDNYVLIENDNSGWGPTLSENSINVENGENRTVTLTVTIPTGAENGARDNIRVTVTSQTDNTIENTASCIAHATVVRGVDVQVTPSVQENARRENVTFTVTVKNTGNVLDNYALTVGDNENWEPTLDDNLFANIAPGDNMQTTLMVTVPENAVPGTEDNITVTATSLIDNTIKDNESCTVRVAFTYGVKVSISPGENSAFPGENVTFTVTVMNTGDNSDNFVLHAGDNLQWELSLVDNLMENIAPEGQRTTKLTVSIPDNAAPDARDNITVTASSSENENVTDNATCIAHSTVIARGVEVSISPTVADGMPGDSLSYTVAVTNTGNVPDNYDLTVIDNAGWSPSISEATLEVPVRENSTATLGVTVPDNAAPGTSDMITVTATSQENSVITASASCSGLALLLKRVEVRISPGYLSGSPGDTLYFVVYITNAGLARNSFDLRTSASGNWLSQVEPSSLTLDPDETENVTLSVLIPSNAKEGDTGIVEVRAISSSDQSVQGADTCRAIVFGAKPGGGVLSMSWIWILLIAALIAVVVFTIGYLTRRRRRGGKRRDVLNK
jgi:uncharacterized membrane protein